MTRAWKLRRSTVGGALCGALLCGAAGAAVVEVEAVGAPGPRAPAELGADLDRILADPLLEGAQVGVVVRDATDGTTLYSRNATQRLLPASNTKLLTAAAALETLGPGYRFSTDVLTGGRDSGASVDRLYLRGDGDPTVLAADYDRLAAQVAKAGIRRVGRLVADDTAFDDVRLGADWAWDDEPYYYAAQVSALTVAPDSDYDAGSVILNVAPGRTDGAGARVSVEPANRLVRVVNRARTGPAGGQPSVSLVREHGSNTVTVTGTVPAGGAPVREWATVWEPTDLAADVFRGALERHGVRVAGAPVRGTTPAGARTVAHHASMELTGLLVPFVKLSNNGHAEVLTKAMGRKAGGRGDWPTGLAAGARALAGLGVESAKLRLKDGSGLSRQDLVSAEQFGRLLLAARSRPWFQAWYAALPVAGDPDRLVGGTLRSRMRGTPAERNVRAKTGSLTGVSGLSGYLTDRSGRPLVFSVLTNNYLPDSVKGLEDRIAVRLAEYPGAATPYRRAVPRPGVRADLECSWVKDC